MSTPDAPPILTAVHARVAVDDVIAIEDLTLETRGDRVLFVGDVTVLFAALSGVPLLAATPDGAATEASGGSCSSSGRTWPSSPPDSRRWIRRCRGR